MDIKKVFIFSILIMIILILTVFIVNRQNNTQEETNKLKEISVSEK